VRKLESNKIDDELKFDDKKEKLYDIKLKNLNKEVTSQSSKNVAITNPNRNK